MGYKCPICERTFSKSFSYSQHAQKCLKQAEQISDEESNNSNEMDTQIIDKEYSNVEKDTDDFESDNNEVQNMSFDSIGSELISEISIMSFEEILEPDTKPANTEFPNDAYKDLMLLVTKHKLSNKAGNEIIQLFNKHSNLKISPLPKNIKSGREFMNNMEISLEFDKVLITRYNDKDYFLYYQNIMNCVTNILTIPGITKDFALSFENYKVNIYVNLNHFINNVF